MSRVTLHYTENEVPANASEDDGTLSGLAEEALSDAGGQICDWEKRGLWIECAIENVEVVKACMEDFKNDANEGLREYMGRYYFYDQAEAV